MLRAKRYAFTLIELLIVVAIIAILAAIAVPNFLEAQVRAQISRAKNDLRSVATAIESYRVDNSKYPLCVEIEDQTLFVVNGTEEVIEGLVPFTITTPIAYMTSLPIDPFPAQEEGLGGGESAENTFHYLDLFTAVTRGEPDTLRDFHEKLYGSPNGSVEWYMFTLGPDLEHDEDITGGEPQFETVLYDPTNGTISNGDIYMFQGKGLGE